uniref:Uncharacterized protein n=1 Tax=Cacopsylla melanoneura TaxID=428564 RepID=A0A8D8Z615_9HEMI
MYLLIWNMDRTHSCGINQLLEGVSNKCEQTVTTVWSMALLELTLHTYNISNRLDRHFCDFANEPFVLENGYSNFFGDIFKRIHPLKISKTYPPKSSGHFSVSYPP